MSTSRNHVPTNQPPPPRATTRRPIDPMSLLAHYESALTRLNTALVEIEGHPSHTMLMKEELQGTTRAELGPVVKNAAQLWDWQEALSRALSDARDLADRGKRATDVQGRNLERLLNTAWIPLDSGGTTSVDNLITLIRGSLDPLRDGVSRIDAVWFDLLPRVDGARMTLARLRQDAERLGVTEPLISVAEGLRDDLEARLMDDPLGIAKGSGEDLDARVRAASDQLKASRRGHDELDGDVGEAEEVLADLLVLRGRAAGAAAETATKISGASGLVRVPTAAVLDGPNGMADRLDAATKGDRPWTQKRALLDTWLNTASKLRAQLLRAEKANTAGLVARDELRGRLAGLRAKMAGTGRSEDLSLLDLVDDIRTQLYSVPSDLDEARQGLEDLAKALSSSQQVGDSA